MFKFIKRFFGLDYNDHVASNQTRPAVEDKGEVLVPVAAPTRPAVEGKGEVPAVKKAPKKPAAKKAAPKKAAKKAK
jgi:hypothetical protein